VPTTPTLTLCDQLVTALAAAWSPTGDDAVERAYFKRWGDGHDSVSELVGRKVTIYPLTYENGPADRGEDEYEHRVGVQILERYTPDGDPTTEWIDERVDFVFQQIVQGFDYLREHATFNRKLWTKSATVRLCESSYLTSGGKVFFSEVEIAFGEIRDA
jgi:hypothetical protein